MRVCLSGMFLLRCWNCGAEWSSEGWEDREECPSCGVEVSTLEEAEAIFE